ncbi:hypothetical protein FB451DRAFT_1178488 [Mycena latifolia]|nr:hypothetical protein FB451DRAFT_1178488 [Mycena latifolia]
MSLFFSAAGWWPSSHCMYAPRVYCVHCHDLVAHKRLHAVATPEAARSLLFCHALTNAPPWCLDDGGGISLIGLRGLRKWRSYAAGSILPGVACAFSPRAYSQGYTQPSQYPSWVKSLIPAARGDGSGEYRLAAPVRPWIGDLHSLRMWGLSYAGALDFDRIRSAACAATFPLWPQFLAAAHMRILRRFQLRASDASFLAQLSHCADSSHLLSRAAPPCTPGYYEFRSPRVTQPPITRLLEVYAFKPIIAVGTPLHPIFSITSCLCRGLPFDSGSSLAAGSASFFFPRTAAY